MVFVEKLASVLPFLLSLFTFLPYSVSASAASASAQPTACMMALMAGQNSEAASDPHDSLEMDLPMDQRKATLLRRVRRELQRSPEFDTIREIAKDLGVRVWLFGGAASSFLHYTKALPARVSKPIADMARTTSIFNRFLRSSQDIDLAINGTVEQAEAFQNRLIEIYPNVGNLKAKWEVRTLYHSAGTVGQSDFKEAILTDGSFAHQHSDSNSVGLIEVSKSSEPLVRDLRHWNQENSLFLEDTLKGQISFLWSARHAGTARASLGHNPAILPVLRLLTKAFQNNLQISETHYKQIQEIIADFDPELLKNHIALKKVETVIKKMILHAANIETTIDKLEELGLRSKLLQLDLPSEKGRALWWLVREPLRARALTAGLGRTARQLGLNVVIHETPEFAVHDALINSSSATPNTWVENCNFVPNTPAILGFCTTDARSTPPRAPSRTVIYRTEWKVSPLAREGIDFQILDDGAVAILNKAVLKRQPLSSSREARGDSPSRLDRDF